MNHTRFMIRKMLVLLCLLSVAATAMSSSMSRLPRCRLASSAYQQKPFPTTSHILTTMILRSVPPIGVVSTTLSLFITRQIARLRRGNIFDNDPRLLLVKTDKAPPRPPDAG